MESVTGVANAVPAGNKEKIVLLDDKKGWFFVEPTFLFGVREF